MRDTMWDLRIANIAGIQSGNATLTDGLNVVQASNFMGKSSFMGAIQTVMGTTGMDGYSHPLTEGATQGSVSLSTPEETYDVRLERSDSGGVARHGTPMLTDQTDRTCARLFAFLGENNPVRARVRNAEDLTPLLQAPLDIEDIDARIASLKQEREAVTDRLREAEHAAENIPPVTEAIGTLEQDLERLRERREELARRATDGAASNGASSDELAECRSRLQTTKQTISRLETRIERAETELDQKRTSLEALDIPDEPDVTADITAKNERIDALDIKLDLLEGLHRANQRVLEEDEADLVSSVERNLLEDEVGCWVCGEPTTTATIHERLDAMQGRLVSLREERETLQEEIAAIEAKQREREEQRRRQSELESEIGDLAVDIDELKGDRRQALDRKERLSEELDELEAAVVESTDEVTEELTDVKADIRTKETELETQRARLEELEARRDEAEELEAEQEQLSAELEAVRNRKREKQWELKEQFDTAMADVIDRFGPGFDGGRLAVKTNAQNDIESFELIIARDGRETDIATLSEGEQELVGIIVALAGHRTFDVGNRIPVVLLDGISQLSAANLQRLTAYLQDASEILVTTAYPEAGDFGGHRISPKEWQTVSDGERSAA